MNPLPTFHYDEAGLLPVVVQDYTSGDVLMVAWANAEAMSLTAQTGLAHFWSRSRNALWKKGETSGHLMKVREVRADCDGDTALLVVEPQGPACHTGSRTCFGERGPSRVSLLDELQQVIAGRATADPGSSYTARLLQRGLDHTLRKIGEEATEVLLAAKGESEERLAEESADLIFHLLVVLQQREVPLALVLDVLARRRGRPPEGGA
jgi:phosphoribosyl-ATP pyrophosphohydrolase/phosphoribosyl-AMP cyclohydrolase